MNNKKTKQNKSKLKILIRTAGGKETGKELGLGHVYRSLNLASELKPNKIHFLLEDYGGARKILEKQNYSNIQILKKNIRLNEDIKKTIDHIKKEEIDLLIVDRYNVKLGYLKKLKKIVKLVIISDLHNIEYPGDLVVNGFIGFSNKIKNNSYKSKCLLGPRYQILNKKFSKKNTNVKNEYDLLITVGGYDEKKIIDLLLKCILPHIHEIKTKIIVGPVGSKSKLTKDIEKKFPSRLKIIKSTKNMKKEMLSAKFGICGGGITSYEFASMKKHFGIICVEKHQLITAREWKKKGIGLNFGITKKHIEKQTGKFIQKISKGDSPYKMKKRNMIDGKGASRIAYEILKIP